MLGKLLKYEMKASARTIVPLYIGMFVIAIVGGVRMRIGIQKMLQESNGVDPYFNVMSYSASGMAELVLVALTIAVMVMTALIVIQRFHRNLLEQEGYLMLTLPVTHTQIILSKLLGAFCWIVCSCLVIAISWLALVLPIVALEEIVNEMRYLWNYWVAGNMSVSTVLLIGGYILRGIIGILGLILSVYFAMMIGQMEQFHRYHMAVSVIAFVGIHWVMSVIYSPISHIIVRGMMYEGYVNTFLMNSMIYGIITGIINIVVFFLGTRWLMQNKLNI